jgi:hypothetical protein
MTCPPRGVLARHRSRRVIIEPRWSRDQRRINLCPPVGALANDRMPPEEAVKWAESELKKIHET